MLFRSTEHATRRNGKPSRFTPSGSATGSTASTGRALNSSVVVTLHKTSATVVAAPVGTIRLAIGLITAICVTAARAPRPIEAAPGAARVTWAQSKATRVQELNELYVFINLMKVFVFSKPINTRRTHKP